MFGFCTSTVFQSREMKCSSCDTEMSEVRVGVRREVANMLLFGMGSSSLMIQKVGRKNWATYLSPDSKRMGFYCDGCEQLVIQKRFG
ncbi:MAG: hypothetical protein CMO55_14820 [Verrucomicrobiales bacterium]|nr:hypothetical protein [Verrucomicrobiales bacterium]